jgi:hypothetical protein
MGMGGGKITMNIWSAGTPMSGSAGGPHRSEY